MSTTPIRILLATLFAATLGQPARAVVALQESPTGLPLAFLERYHRIGAQHRNVAGILGIDPEHGALPHATGTLVGFSKDGAHGYLLTAAHPFFEGPDSDRVAQGRPYRICFDPVLPEKATAGLQAAPSRLIVHPGRTRATVTAVKPPFVLESKSGASMNDLALLEFPAASLRPALEKAAVAPAVLYGPEGWAKTDVDARVVGYGFYGTTWTRGFFIDNHRIHGGNTTVSYATYGDLTGFFHWSPMHPMALEEALTRPFGTAPYRFVAGAKGANLVNPLDGGSASVRSAKAQVMTATGDSGGPLFLNTTKGLRLAGVCTSARRADLRSAFSDKPDVPCYLEHWTALRDCQGWIDGVLAGDLGTSPVVAFREGAPGSALAAPLVGDRTHAKEETKAEIKAETGTERKLETKVEAGTAGAGQGS